MKSSAVTGSEQVGAEKSKRTREKFTPLLTLLLVIAISLGLFFYGRDPERVAELKNYGYLGAFLISLVGNATILLPVAVMPILAAMGGLLYPVTGIDGPIIVALVGGVGAGIGEIAGYMAGHSGRGVVGKNKLYLRLAGWMRRWGALGIFLFTLFPFFFDLAGIAAGVLRYPLWKFVLVCWLGRTLSYVIFVLLFAVWGWGTVLRFFG